MCSSQPAENTKVGRAVDTLESRAAIQRDLDRVDTWADRDLQVKGKGKVLHLGWSYTTQQYRLGSDWLVSSFAERDPGSRYITS